MTGQAIGRLGTVDSARWLIEEIFRPVRRAEVVCSLIGAAVAGKMIWCSSRAVWRAFKLFVYEQYFARIERLSQKFGNWAVITGIGEGLGAEFARQFAAQGMNIIVTGTNQELLVQLARGIASGYGVQVKYFLIDLQSPTSYLLLVQFAEQIRRLNIGILVNNAGASLSKVNERLDTVPHQVLWKQLQMGLIVGVISCRMVINEMLTNGKGAIINIAPSVAPDVTVAPYFLAQRKFIIKFSKSLAAEYGKDKFTILTLTPYDINYHLSDYEDRYNNQSFFVPTPYLYVRSALRMLGKIDVTTGYWAHGLQYCLCKLIPGKFWTNTRNILQTMVWRQGRPKKYYQH